MNFKYFENYKLASLAKNEVLCGICNEVKESFDYVVYDETIEAEIECVCLKCLAEKKLYGRKITTNEIVYPDTITTHLKEYFSTKSSEELEIIENKLTQELTQATPMLHTHHEIDWPCADGDFMKFIGYGSKPLFNKLASDGNGERFFKENLHLELKEYYANRSWKKIVIDKEINTIDDYWKEDEIEFEFYVFKSVTTNKYIILGYTGEDDDEYEDFYKK